MNDNNDVPNPELREHVSAHQFVLTLHKTHIIMLIAVATGNLDAMHALRASISAAHGLKRRGLLLHCSDVYGRPNGLVGAYFPHGKHRDAAERELHHLYRLTRAGWAVYDLLVEAGLAEAVDRRSRKYAA